MFHILQQLYYDDKTNSFKYREIQTEKSRLMRVSPNAHRLHSPWEVLDDYSKVASETFESIQSFSAICSAIIAKDEAAFNAAINYAIQQDDDVLSIAIPGQEVNEIFINTNVSPKEVVLKMNGASIPLARWNTDHWELLTVSDSYYESIKSSLPDLEEALASYSTVTDFIGSIQAGAEDTTSIFQQLSLKSGLFSESTQIVVDLFNSFRDGGITGLVSAIGTWLLSFKDAQASGAYYIFPEPEYRSLSVLGFIRKISTAIDAALRTMFSIVFGAAIYLPDTLVSKLSNIVPQLEDSVYTVSRNWTNATFLLPLESGQAINSRWLPVSVVEAFNREVRGRFVVKSHVYGDNIYAMDNDGNIFGAFMPTLNYNFTIHLESANLVITGISVDQYGVTMDYNYRFYPNLSGYYPLEKEKNDGLAETLKSILLNAVDPKKPITLSDEEAGRIASGIFLTLVKGITVMTDPDDPEEDPEQVYSKDGLRYSVAASNMSAYDICLAYSAYLIYSLHNHTISSQNAAAIIAEKIIPNWKNVINDVSSYGNGVIRYTLRQPSSSTSGVIVSEYDDIYAGGEYFTDPDEGSYNGRTFTVANYHAAINPPRSNLGNIMGNVLAIILGAITVIITTKMIAGTSRLLFRKKIRNVMRSRYAGIANLESRLGEAVANNNADLVQSLSAQLNNQVFQYNLLSKVFKYNRLGYIDGWINSTSGGWLNTAANITSTVSNITSTGSTIATNLGVGFGDTNRTLAKIGKLITKDF